MIALRLLGAICLFVCLSFAQLATSRLEGTVADESGAVVPGAKISVVNPKTQYRAETTAGAEGLYIFPSLPPGTYTVMVESSGFRKSVIADVELTVGATLNQKVKLEVGQVSESVSVQANAVRVETSDAQVGHAVTLRDIDTLPSLGRGPLALAVYNPGMQIDPSDNSYTRVNGTRQGSSNTTLDGIQVNDPVAPRFGLQMTPATTDTVEELRVVTNGGKAEYGRSAGGQVQMVTRGGTNSFHGAGYDYLRNTVLNANTFFSNQSGQARPVFIQNQFGGRFEGPVKKDRTFFFGSYEGRRTNQQVVRNRTVLTPQLKQGLFRWRTTPTSDIQTFDIVKNDPRNKGIDPNVKSIFAQLPDPNNYDLGDGLNTAGFRFNAPASSFNDQYTFKIDHNLTSHHRLFFRWSWMRTYSIDTTNSSEARYPGQPDGRQGGHRNGWSVGSDWSISPTMINELRVGGQKSNSDFLRPRLHETMLYSNTYTEPIAPTDFAQGRTVPYTEITDSLSKIHGKHTMKAGVNLRFTEQLGWREDYAWPTVYLSRAYGNTPPATVGPQTGISSTDRTSFENLYNDVLGRMSYVYGRFYSDLAKFQPSGTARSRTHEYHEYGFFAQDDWKIRPNLTLNFGLRYEFFGVPFEKDGLQGNFDQVDKMNFVNKITNLSVVKGAPFYNNDYNNFAPRFGFAWDVRGDGKTAIRGGSGIFYDRIINATLSPVDLNTPGFNQDSYVYPNLNPGSDVRMADGVPALVVPGAPVLQVPANRQNTAATVMNPNLRTGYVVQTNFNVQQEVFRNTVVELGYVGTRGIKMFMQTNLNQPRIREDFLTAFKELQAFRTNGTPVSATNSLVKIFGSTATAISSIGASTIDTGSVGSAAATVDNSYYTRYAAAGIPDTYLRNYPQFGYAYYGTNDGHSAYDSAQLSLRRTAGALKFQANYTFAKSIDNWANEGNGTSAGSIMDYTNLRLNRARSDFDKTHSFNSMVMYTLPIGRNKRLLGSSSKLVDSLLGGWDVGAVNVWQSGNLFTMSSGRATGPNQGASAWANYSGPRTIGGLDRRGNGIYFFSADELAQFSFPGAGEIGTSGRNAFRGPRFFNVDASLSKTFSFTERIKVKARAEAYNLFNNANFGTPGVSLLTPASLGKFSGTIGGARTIQAALRFEF